MSTRTQPVTFRIDPTDLALVREFVAQDHDHRTIGSALRVMVRTGLQFHGLLPGMEGEDAFWREVNSEAG